MHKIRYYRGRKLVIMKTKMRDRLLICLLIIPLLGAGLLPVDIKLNGKVIDTPLLSSEEEFFLPIKTFSQLTSMQFTERSSGDVIIFRDNIFIKFNINSNIYYLNGKELKWKNPPFKKNNELYVPYRVLLDYMNFHYNLDDKEISITGGSQDVSLSYLQNRQKVDFVDAKISYILPFFWKRSSPNSFSQEETDSFIEVTTGPLGEGDLEDVISRRLEELELEDFDRNDSKNLLIEGRRILHRSFIKKDKDDKMTSYYGLSFFTLENRYVETFFFNHSQSPSSAIKLEEEILSSLQLNAYTIDEREEHYVELGGFFALGMELDLPLYSNMVVDKVLVLKGSIHPSVTRLRATVKRGKRSFDYSFPVEEGKFKARIPIPFGLGFHSLSLAIPASEEELSQEGLDFFEGQDSLLMFSLLNTSLEEGLLLSYSDSILSQEELVGELSSQVKGLSYDYDKARRLMEILGDNFSLGTVVGPGQALETRTLDRKTSALIYGALLRRSGIPTRIISNKSQTLFGVEILSNGLWHILDPYGYLREGKDSSLFMSLPKDYFGREPILHDI